MFAAIYNIFYMIMRKTVLFFIAGLMCLNSFTAPVPQEPQVLNKDTGNYFLPDYGNTLISSHRSGKGPRQNGLSERPGRSGPAVQQSGCSAAV